jgi:hypothetical protein
MGIGAHWPEMLTRMWRARREVIPPYRVGSLSGKADVHAEYIETQAREVETRERESGASPSSSPAER